MSTEEKLQETLDCINQNLVVLVHDQQELYLLLERICKEIKDE
jgi:hypothetical protein